MYPRSCFTIPSLDYINNFKNAWLIGGAKLINSSWNMIDEVHLTKTLTEYTCDRYIELLYLEQNFNMISEEQNIDHVYQIWKRKWV
jgi:dihydrofolate reductase